jgi:hypothetical protein
VTGGELAAAMQRNATAAIVNVARVIVLVSTPHSLNSTLRLILGHIHQCEQGKA